MSRLVQSDLFKRVNRRWEERHASLLNKTLMKQGETVGHTLQREFEWDGKEHAVTCVARFNPESKKVLSTEWATVGELWESVEPLVGWGGFQATDGQAVADLKVRWKVNGASVVWRREGQSGRNVSGWLKLNNNSDGFSCDVLKSGGEPITEDVARADHGIELEDFKEAAQIRFVLQNSREVEFATLYCQCHFMFGGEERVNMEAWPNVRSCPELMPCIAIKHSSESQLGRPIRYFSGFDCNRTKTDPGTSRWRCGTTRSEWLGCHCCGLRASSQ